ncbi:MAG TPA: hypothetical protein VGG72_28895 [Bryobacteraceae bacterium]|jgi:hypothetical protein
MKRSIRLSALLAFSLAASAQRTPPDNLKICFSGGECVSMMMVSDSYIGWTGPTMNTEWRFTVDAWTMKELRLSGRATLREDIFQHSDRWVIKASPDMITDGAAHGKAKDISGHDKRAGKVAITWQPSRPQLYGRVVR